jgi:hypothetical protein
VMFGILLTLFLFSFTFVVMVIYLCCMFPYQGPII